MSLFDRWCGFTRRDAAEVCRELDERERRRGREWHGLADGPPEPAAPPGVSRAEVAALIGEAEERLRREVLLLVREVLAKKGSA